MIRAYEEQMAAIEKLGGRLIVMASRALARVAQSPGRLRARLRPRAAPGARAGDPALARRHVRPRAAPATGAAPTPHAAMDTALGVIDAHAAKVDGIKISLLDKDKEIAMRRRLPGGVRMYTGDDFNYAELIAGDGVGRADAAAQRRAARHLRRHRAGRERGAGRAGGRRRGALPRDPRADRAAVAPHLQGADALLQDRRRLHGLAQRPAGPLRDGRRAAEHALAAALVRAVPAGRRGRVDRADPSSRSRRMKHAAGAARRRLHDATSRSDHRWLSINTATVRKQRGWTGPAGHPRCLRRRGIRAIAPWRDQVAAAGLQATAQRLREHGLALSGYCRGGMFTCSRCRRPPGRARRQPPRGRRGRDAAARPAWCWWSAACRARWPATRRTATSPRAREQVSDGIAALLEDARASRDAAGHRAAAPDVGGRPRLHQHAGAGARRLRRARARRGQRRRARRGGRRLPRLVGPEARSSRSSAPAPRACSPSRLRLADADHRPAQRPRHDGRRRDRHSAHPRLGRGAGLRRV